MLIPFRATKKMDPPVAAVAGPDQGGKGLKKLSEELTCPVCHDHFEDPKVLSCLHYYCKKCIKQITNQVGEDQPIQCPECRKETIVPENDPSNLPTAFFINRTKEVYSIMKKAKQGCDLGCEMCSKPSSKATAFCRHCAEFICKYCTEVHSNVKTYTGHSVIMLDDLKQNVHKHLPIQKTAMICTKHEEQMKLYCLDCHQLICRDCIIIDHKDHKFQFVKEYAASRREVLSDSIAPLKQALPNVITATTKVQETLSAVSVEDENVSQTIKQSFARLRQVLEECEQELLCSTGNIVRRKLDALTPQHKSLDITGAELESLLEFVDYKVASASDEELLSIHRQLFSRIEEVNHRCQQLELEPVEVAGIALKLPPAEVLRATCLQNTALVNSPTQILKGPGLIISGQYKCTLDGLECVETGKLSQFRIRLTDASGQACEEELEVAVEMKSVVSGSYAKCNVTGKPSGVFLVSYTPATRGRYEILVSVDGKLLSDCLFTTLVKPSLTELSKPVQVIDGIASPCGIALQEQMVVVTGFEGSGKISFFSKNGEKMKQLDLPSSPIGIALHSGHLCVADEVLMRVVKISEDGTTKATVGKQGNAAGEFNHPGAVKIRDDGSVFVCDRGNNRIQVFDTNLKFIKFFGSPGQFQWPVDVAFSNGRVFVGENQRNCVQVCDEEGLCLQIIGGGQGSKPGELYQPTFVCIYCDLLFVVEEGNRRVSVFHTNGDFVTTFGQFEKPYGIAVDEDCRVYICDKSSNQVYIF